MPVAQRRSSPSQWISFKMKEIASQTGTLLVVIVRKIRGLHSDKGHLVELKIVARSTVRDQLAKLLLILTLLALAVALCLSPSLV